MSRIKILYHPKFEPQEDWLRAMLLFYDTVYSMVPNNAGYIPSPGIASLCEKVPEAFVPLSPTPQDLQYGWDQYHALSAVLHEFGTNGEGKKRVRAHFDWSDGTPALTLGSTVRVHNDKMADELKHQLLELGLAERTDDEQWLNVDERVADPILSMLAARMKENRPEIDFTSSDLESSFAVTTKSDLTRQRSGAWNAEAVLASAILTAEIPTNLAKLPLDQYLDVRKRYEENRDVFRLAMQELQSLYLQRSFDDPTRFHQELEQVVIKYSRQVQELRQRQFKQDAIRWAPVLLGGIVTIAAAAVSLPILAVPAACIGVTLQVLQTAQHRPIPGTNVAQSQSLLVKLGRELQWNRSWLGRVFSS